MKQFTIIIAFLTLITGSVLGQRELNMSQYMYNRYSINPAFGGSHESLSAYASYRKKWLGFEDSPTGAFFTIHSPLKKENVALGAQFFSDKFGVSQNTGFNLSYTYRLQLDNQSTLAFGISGGIVNHKSDWTQVRLSDSEYDETFASVEQTMSPLVGFGVSIYNKKYFGGFSIPSLLYYDRYETAESSLDFAKIDYLFTGGFIHKVSNSFAIQPSALIRVNLDDKSFAELSATGILMNSLMVGTSYRTTNEIIGIIGYQITPQFRFTYSLDYDIDPIGSYNNGTHEVALQFDFGYKIDSPDPKFF
ncbi:PorP/SprF family type IX secretion system membrane protein [Labilibacter marinus]|uniref:PorP/SprF family type IX secretion system membrane protein n=1 Tax=Labilibacter marinus TaxID=1477105 RepID=UPI00094F5A78|nr:type IX secretion system membrane protein PorP/SprF [Labilibacter marinus]